uniref:FLYWCH-type domain-containing protein n=1 Tax=Ditylenchus dipsaci TaxID=166011 RepID=A0A915CSR7_9BILA
MNFELLTSKKNKPMLKDPTAACTGILVFREEKGTYWRCIHYRVGWMVTENTKCQGKAVTFDGNFELTAAHNHYGDEIHAEMKRFQVSFRSKQSQARPPRSIIGKALKEVSKEAWGRIRRSFAAKNIRSIRHENNLEPANPKNLQLLVKKFGQGLKCADALVHLQRSMVRMSIREETKFSMTLNAAFRLEINMILALDSGSAKLWDEMVPKIYAFDSFFYPELAKKGPKAVLNWMINSDLFYLLFALFVVCLLLMNVIVVYQ